MFTGCASSVPEKGTTVKLTATRAGMCRFVACALAMSYVMAPSVDAHDSFHLPSWEYRLAPPVAYMNDRLVAVRCYASHVSDIENVRMQPPRIRSPHTLVVNAVAWRHDGKRRHA